MRWYVAFVWVRAARVKKGVNKVESGAGGGGGVDVVPNALSSSSR